MGGVGSGDKTSMCQIPSLARIKYLQNTVNVQFCRPYVSQNLLGQVGSKNEKGEGYFARGGDVESRRREGGG